MWPNKDYILYKASFSKEGKAIFEFNSKDNLLELECVNFALNVYIRIHSHYKNSSVQYFNDLLKHLSLYSQSLGLDEAISILDKIEGDVFLLVAEKMHNNKESFIYKWTGLNIQSVHLIARLPINGLESNMSFAFIHLLVHLNRNLSIDSKRLLLMCFTGLTKYPGFLEKKYNFLACEKIAKEILTDQMANL